MLFLLNAKLTKDPPDLMELGNWHLATLTGSALWMTFLVCGFLAKPLIFLALKKIFIYNCRNNEQLLFYDQPSRAAQNFF